MAIYDRERYKVVLPQLEKRLEHLENGVDITVKEVLSEPVSTTSNSTTATATAEIKKIKGYTPYAVSAYMAIAGSGYTFCNIYNVRVDGNKAKCAIKYLGTSTATDVKVKFKVIYIANKMLTAGTATASSSGGGSGGGGTNDYNDLINKPSIEGVTLEGDKTFEELGLHIVEDKNYVHVQATPSADWYVNHGLNKMPSISVVDSAGSEIVGDYEYGDDNNVILHFNAQFSGKAYFN